MWSLCTYSAGTLLRLWCGALRRPAGPRHAICLLLAGPALLLYWSGTWLGFLIDDLCFRGWRNVRVTAPLFILGVPRSGTTSLHRAFATVPGTTTFSSWELWFGLPVCMRKILGIASRIDRRLGRPGRRMLKIAEQKLFQGLEASHPTGLHEPEEDYFALAPAGGCFLLWLLFPEADHVWNTARMDTALPERDRRHLVQWYRICWQKHLFVHGTDQFPLSKNAAFAGCIHTLAEAFPEARFLCCWRPAEETVPSLLNTVDDALKSFGLSARRDPIRRRLTDTMCHFYGHLYPAAIRLGDRAEIIPLSRQREDLPGIIRATWTRFGRTLPNHFEDALGQLGEQSRAHRSRHTYDPDQLGVDPEWLATWPHATTPPESI